MCIEESTFFFNISHDIEINVQAFSCLRSRTSIHFLGENCIEDCLWMVDQKVCCTSVIFLHIGLKYGERNLCSSVLNEGRECHTKMMNLNVSPPARVVIAIIFVVLIFPKLVLVQRCSSKFTVDSFQAFSFPSFYH